MTGQAAETGGHQRGESDMANDLKEQLGDKLKETRFALQFDEATDSNKDCLFIAYVCFDEINSLCQDLLFL